MLKESFVQLAMQNFMLQGFSGKFNMESFHRRKKSFVAPLFNVNAYAGASEKKVELAYPVLYYQLKKLRDNICARKNQPIYLVAGSKTLEEMTTYLPQTLEELEQISGFGKARVKAYGDDFLAIIKEYSEENDLSSRIADKVPGRKRREPATQKKDTKAETFKLYQEGKTVSDIARQRNLTPQTIENHLSHFVEKGMIKLEDLVTREKIVLIEPVARDFAGGPITQIKEKLGSQVSFGEIRLVLASIEHQRSSSHIDH
jgi:ATP-dependent DNA helicase RecQ